MIPNWNVCRHIFTGAHCPKADISSIYNPPIQEPIGLNPDWYACFFTNAQGSEFLLNLVRPGEVFGLPLDEADLLRVIGAATQQKSTILSIEGADLLQAMETMPQLAKNLYHAASISARMLLTHVRVLITLGLNARLAFLLLRLSDLWQSADTLEMPIHQTELAGWLGVSRGRLNRALSELQKDGLISMDDTQILLLDRAGLEHLVMTGA